MLEHERSHCQKKCQKLLFESGVLLGENVHFRNPCLYLMARLYLIILILSVYIILVLSVYSYTVLNMARLYFIHYHNPGSNPLEAGREASISLQVGSINIIPHISRPGDLNLAFIAGFRSKTFFDETLERLVFSLDLFEKRKVDHLLEYKHARSNSVCILDLAYNANFLLWGFAQKFFFASDGVVKF